MRDEIARVRDERDQADADLNQRWADVLVSELEERLSLHPGSTDTGMAITRAAMHRVLRFSGEREFVRYADTLIETIKREKDVMLAEALRGFDSRMN